MKYAYKLHYKHGGNVYCVQNHYFTEEEVLNAFKGDGVVKVSFYRTIPSGYHLCSCGNLVKGTDERVMCDECRQTYGHTYEYEL